MLEDTMVAAPVFDPFRYGIELPLETNVNALGFPMRLVTNSRDIIKATEESWAGYPQLFTDKSLEFRVIVSDDESLEPATDNLGSRVQRHLLHIISNSANFAVCDMDKGFASFWLAPATARNREFFRYYYLMNALYVMVWHTHLTSVHAAGIARNGRGVLLCGDSGAGKTCLSFACARRGWDFITDEAVSLVRRSPERTVVGGTRHMHFRESALDLLPELRGRLARVLATGKLSVEVNTNEFPEIRRIAQTRVDAVVFLNRDSGGPARLAPIAVEDAFSRLERELPLMDRMEDHRAALRHLAEAGSFELRYRDLDDAVTVLESLVR
jgi:shikimate kinase